MFVFVRRTYDLIVEVVGVGVKCVYLCFGILFTKRTSPYTLRLGIDSIRRYKLSAKGICLRRMGPDDVGLKSPLLGI